MLVSYSTEGNSALSESRKNDKIASSDVARPHVNGITLQLAEYKCSMYRLMRHGTSSAPPGRDVESEQQQ
jgi:hypothetical protein